MANEAVLLVETDHPINFTVANGTGIEKGTLLKLTDPRTAIISTATGDKIAGIAASEKILSNGQTQLGVFRRGQFRMIISGSVLIGQALQATDTTQHPNHVGGAPLTASGSSVIGTALEAGTTGQTIRVDLNVGTGGS